MRKVGQEELGAAELCSETSAELQSCRLSWEKCKVFPQKLQNCNDAAQKNTEIAEKGMS